MGLRSERIVKIRIYSPKENTEKVLSLLHDYRIIQLEEVSSDIKSELKSYNVPELKDDIILQMNRMRNLEGMMFKRNVDRKYRFNSLQEVMEKARNIRIDEDLKIATQMISEINNEQKIAFEKLEVLERIKNLDTDISYFNNSAVSTFIIEGNYKNPDPNVFGEIRISENSRIIIVPKGEEKAFSQSLSRSGLKTFYIMQMSGKPSDLIVQNRKLIDELEKKKNEITALIKEISDKHYGEIAALKEALEIEAKKVEAALKFPSSKTVFVAEGWIQKSKYNILIDDLNSVTGNRCIVEIVKTDEKPPTLQRNPKRLKMFESIIRFYSLPENAEVDPTLIIAFVFPIFFGFMTGDFGFGIAVILLSLFIIHRVDHGGKFPLPKKLTRFVLSIFTPYQLKGLAKVLLPGGIAAIISGIIFNEFFGFQILPANILGYSISYINPLTYTPKMLLITGYIGLFMVLLGLVIGIYDETLYGEIRHAIGKVGWILFITGVATLGLGLLRRAPLSFSSVPFDIEVAIILAGIVIIGVAEKPLGLVELPSIISHVVSYTRIVGILLASVVLTLLINSFFTYTLGDPVLIVVGILVLILGQLFTFILAVVESTIQGVRLIYVEFFSKFYHGNGRPFSPFGTPRRFTEEMYRVNQEKSSS